MHSFDHFFHERIQPFINTHQNNYKKAQTLLVIAYSLLGIFSVCLISLFFIESLISFFVIFATPFLMITAGILIVIAYFKIRSINLAFKESIMGDFIQLIHPSFQHETEGYLARKLVEETQLLKLRPSYAYEGEDLITGKVSNINIIFSRIEIEEPRSSDDGGSRTIFKGFVYAFEPQRRFPSDMVLLPKSKIHAVKGLKKVTIKNAYLQRNYIVYAEDEAAAKTMLSSSFLNSLQHFLQKEKKNIPLAFKNGKIFMAIPNAYEPFSLRVRGNLDKEAFQRYLDELAKPIVFTEILRFNHFR